MFAEDFIQLVQQNNLGTYGTNLFQGPKAVIPGGAGPFTSFVETGGSAPELIHNDYSQPAWIKPSMQVMVRAESFDLAVARAWAIWSVVFPIRNAIVNGHKWRDTHMRQTPFPMGLDETGKRVRIAFNFDATIEPGIEWFDTGWVDTGNNSWI